MNEVVSNLWDSPHCHVGRYENRVAFVTGGASGIGEAVVVRLLREGAGVVIADLNEQRGLELLEAARKRGCADRARFFRCNVTNQREIDHLLRFLDHEFGKLDLAVNCAGAGGAIGPFLSTTPEAWDDTFTLVLKSVFLGTMAAAKYMNRHGFQGSIVNLSSVAGVLVGISGVSYASAKAGVISLTKNAAIHLGPMGIRCNALCPGSIITPLLKRGDTSGLLERAAINSQPWPDFIQAEHVAALILFLGSDQASFITGAVVDIDGGLHAGGPMICEWDRRTDT